ncbi:hypothetical protein [Streptomyces griseocarneus]|uniref:hypothetical protein n=1 Tax=Streptomyces griseocarneus TaxID=51201 RepID=UPI00167EED62|nr:hypothetical protein [Streptomyces griseocarneus]MBZ6478101.1 hypothetical protein [Streptomyces griseocarneus]GHG83736.1 hypothetical protein GCM10018779_66990 [Streptomyces griseocarneus]
MRHPGGGRPDRTVAGEKGAAAMDPRRGDYQTQARYFAPLTVLDSEILSERQEELARAVPEVMLLAGLPPYNVEAATDGEEAGVAVTPEDRRALRVLWHQDATAATHLPMELRDAQQAAMHQVLVDAADAAHLVRVLLERPDGGGSN